MEITVQAFAKLNISLDVVSKMDNGYHAMKMVMQSVDLCDELRVSVNSGSGNVKVTTNRVYLPGGNKNSAGKAAELFMSSVGITDADVTVDIRKKIPVCAGMAGGSADAAAVLRALNTLFETRLDERALEIMGEKLGSDVPYCVAGGTVLAEGRGEILTELPPLPDCTFAICKPAFSVSTPELFSRIRCDKIKCRPDTAGILAALKRSDLKEIGRRSFNVFEDVLTQGREDVNMIKGTFFDFGALGAAMTGTGSAVFGMFENEEDAKAAIAELSHDFRECFTAKNTKKLDI